MATTQRYKKDPVTGGIVPARDASGQTAAELAEQAGLSQGEVMAENQNQNPDTMIGGALETKKKAAAAAAASASGADAPPAPAAPADSGSSGMITYPDGSYSYGSGDKSARYAKDGRFLGYGAPPAGGAGTGDSYDEAYKRYMQGLDTEFTDSDEAEIRRKTQDEFQAELDAIDDTYKSILSDADIQNQDDLGRTRAIAARGGLIGSDFGEAQRLGTVRNNNRRIEAINAQKAMAKAAVFGRIDARAKERIDAERAAADKNSDTYLAGLKQFRDDARANVTNLAKAGISLSDLSDDEYRKLLQDSEYDDFELRMIYNANLPESEKIKYESKLENGQLVIWGIDPATGKPVIHTQSVAGDTSKFDPGQYKPTITPDGTVLMVPEKLDPTRSLDDQILRYGEEGQFEDLPKGGSDGDPDRLLTVAEAKALGVPYGTTVADAKGKDPAADEKKAQDDAAKLVLQDKIDLIDSLLDSKGLPGSVGPYGVSRWTPFTADQADRQEFAAGVQQLIGKETMDALTKLKAQGGTLGALSDQERIMLQNSATKIAAWMQKDGKGNPTGKFEVSEEAFKAELNRIRKIAQDALDRAGKSAEGANLDTQEGIDEFLDSIEDDPKAKGGAAAASTLSVKLPNGSTKQGGSASWRNNNPLNIKLSDYSKKYGASKGSAATDGGHFAAFPSVAVGYQAARDLLRAPSYKNLTLEAAMRRWSGNGYGADVAPASLRNKKTGQMTDKELTQLVQSMTRREGWQEGKTYA